MYHCMIVLSTTSQSTEYYSDEGPDLGHMTLSTYTRGHHSDRAELKYQSLPVYEDGRLETAEQILSARKVVHSDSPVHMSSRLHREHPPFTTRSQGTYMPKTDLVPAFHGVAEVRQREVATTWPRADQVGKALSLQAISDGRGS